MTHPEERQSRPCEEPQHTKGTDVRQCRTCAKAVCMPCIVKSSMPNPNENIFQSRRRLLCKACWHRDRALAEIEISSCFRQLRSGQRADIPSFLSANIPRGPCDSLLMFRQCACTVHDGTLCHACKTQHLAEAQLIEARCMGPGCSALVTLENFGGSRCRWCSLPCGSATRIERREIFRARRRSTVTFMNAVGMVEEWPEEVAEEWPGPAADVLPSDGVLDEGGRCDSLGTKALRQARVEPTPDDGMAKMYPSRYDAIQAAQARFRAWEEALPLRKRWSGGKSRPLIREGEMPKSLALFRPLVADDELGERISRRGMRVASVVEDGDEDGDTLFDGGVDWGTLKDGDGETLEDGNGGGKGRGGDDEKYDDDARTVTSVGSTLFDWIDTSEEMIDRDLGIPPRPPPYGSVVTTEVDRQWALFCANGF